jgi:hypothetical protein
MQSLERCRKAEKAGKIVRGMVLGEDMVSVYGTKRASMKR